MKCLRDLLFTDDAAVSTHSAEDLQQLFQQVLPRLWTDHQPKENRSCLGMCAHLPTLQPKHELDVVHDFVYIGSTISDTLSLESELNRRISKEATSIRSLTKRVWSNKKLTENTQIQVY